MLLLLLLLFLLMLLLLLLMFRTGIRMSSLFFWLLLLLLLLLRFVDVEMLWLLVNFVEIVAYFVAISVGVDGGREGRERLIKGAL